jgi:NitT/TauT family transport system substrate-binding protein
MVLARNDWIENRPEHVQAFVNATIEGWRSYVYGDPSPGNQLILAANPDMTPEIIEQAIEQMRSRAMLQSEDTNAHGIGTMTRERWQMFFDTMSAHGVYAPTLNWQHAFTTRFVNQTQVSQPASAPANR